MEVMLAEVMALNAYSGRCLVSGHDDSVRIETAGQAEVDHRRVDNTYQLGTIDPGQRR